MENVARMEEGRSAFKVLLGKYKGKSHPKEYIFKNECHWKWVRLDSFSLR